MGHLTARADLPGELGQRRHRVCRNADSDDEGHAGRAVLWLRLGRQPRHRHRLESSSRAGGTVRGADSMG